MSLPNLAINPQRLWDMLMETARFGGTPRGGIRRLTLTQEDRQVRDWFREETERLGCVVTVDEIGNMFATRHGKCADLKPIAMGSHLDTQPTGGKFDGVLGVLGALEAMKTLVEAGYETNAPIEIVNWTNEEGSRYAPAMLASGVYAGAFSRDYAYEREDRQGIRFLDALEGIGYRGAEPVGAHQFQAMFELHIEQGPILEDEGKVIGVVQGVQGMRWYEVTVSGQDAHAHAPHAVGTVGLIENRPNSRNVIPGEVFFTVDFRHPDDDVLAAMELELRASLSEILVPLSLSWDEQRIWDCPPVTFHPELIDCVRIGADKAGLSHRDMISGAGHDAAYVARVAPTTMIFVPCLGGVSHNEAESSTLEECAAGAQVLLNAVLEYDSRIG